LQCGLCSECLECVVACGAIKAVNHAQIREELIEHAGVVIIADPSIAPIVKGEDVIRAYGPRSAKTDVYAMYVRGFASAAQAMMLLGKTSQRPKGHGVSFSPPDPGLSPEIRLGVFVCKCNESLGWLDEMSRYVEEMTNSEDVVHSEILNAACVQEDTAGIIRTIREKGITRVVLASCVCCPLNFICNSCTDQRSRLKETLFQGTGISRSMIETCNIRGEALRLVEKDTSLALSRFEG
ncbi:MAG: 4Fe-4S ferredoxin, partial [bacterium]|nr:4Fe-4S ferredoxin [bacterium]